MMSKMADGVCRDVFCSYCLVKSKCKESADICANCENLQYQLREALSELSSAKYIIKLLQKDLSTTSAFGSEHFHRYETSHSTYRGYESSSNIESIQGPNNGWIPKIPNQFMKPRKYTKYGNMPTGEYIKTSNRFEPLSNLIDLTKGNSFNEEIKPANLNESENVNQTTSRQKHVNKTSKCSSSQPNLQDNSDSHPPPIHPIEMLTRTTPGKISQREKPKIVVVGDSFAKGIASELVHNLGSAFEVIGHVRPGSGMKVITELANQEITTLMKKDMVVVWGGANDIARNEANNTNANKANNIINSVKSRKHTNVFLVSVPTRFDLLSTSCVNKEVITYNRKLYKWMKQYEHVKITDSESQRKYFTRHGMHMNLAGKEVIAQRITEHIKEHFSKRETSSIILQWKQEMVKRTALT